MKKYIVPSEDQKGWKLIASRAIPSHAIAEVPDHFTREMEPYIRVDHKDGRVLVTLDPSWEKNSHESANKKLAVDLVRMKVISDGIKRAEQNKKFNKLNPAQRYLKSILGDWTTSVTGSIGRSIMLAIFKDKLY